MGKFKVYSSSQSRTQNIYGCMLMWGILLIFAGFIFTYIGWGYFISYEGGSAVAAAFFQYSGPVMIASGFFMIFFAITLSICCPTCDKCGGSSTGVSVVPSTTNTTVVTRREAPPPRQVQQPTGFQQPPPYQQPPPQQYPPVYPPPQAMYPPVDPAYPPPPRY